MSQDNPTNNIKGETAELEQIKTIVFACVELGKRFADHTDDSIRSKALPYVDDLVELRQQAAQEAVDAVIGRDLTHAIAATDEYAKGWNDCRKQIRENVNHRRLAALGDVVGEQR